MTNHSCYLSSANGDLYCFGWLHTDLYYFN